MLDLASAIAGGWTGCDDGTEPGDSADTGGIVSGIDLSPLDASEVLTALGLDADEA